jgi:hypothetical protein
MGVEQAGKRVIDQKEIFALAQGRERVEPLELGIDEAGMTHHHAPVRQPAKEPGKDLGIVRVLRKGIGPGEGGIDAHAIPVGEAAETAAQYVERNCLSVGQAFVQWTDPPALPHPNVWCDILYYTEQRLTNLWK